MAMKSTNLNSPLGRPCKPLEVAHVPGDDIENACRKTEVPGKIVLFHYPSSGCAS
jgi:hypothetical protein